MPETLLKSTFLAILQGFPTFHFHYPDYNEGLIKLCQEMGCTFIDNSTIVTDSSENLYEPDGEHVIQDYYPKWLTNMAQIAGLKA